MNIAGGLGDSLLLCSNGPAARRLGDKFRPEREMS